MAVLLGAIADDFDGRDRPVQHARAAGDAVGSKLIDVPPDGAPVPDAEAVVVGAGRAGRSRPPMPSR